MKNTMRGEIGAPPVVDRGAFQAELDGQSRNAADLAGQASNVETTYSILANSFKLSRAISIIARRGLGQV
jgi:hypothetical protein